MKETDTLSLTSKLKKIGYKVVKKGKIKIGNQEHKKFQIRSVTKN